MLLVGHGIGYHETMLAARRCLDPVSRVVLISGAPWYTGDLEIEGRYSKAFSRWEDSKRYPKRAGLACALVGAELFPCRNDCGT